ncbi:hypothetical protein ACFV4N_02720 [Actinosynnema sp. NPDC059797]
MNGFRRLSVRAVLAAVTSVALVAVSAPTATAEANPYTPRDVCGSGYYVLDGGRIAIRRPNDGPIYGYAYMMYNSAVQKNCVALIKSVDVGVKSFTYVGIQVRGTNVKGEGDDFEYYAGPVYKYAPGQCVRVIGTVWNRAHTLAATGESAYRWCD